MLKTAALDVTSYGGELSGIDVPAVSGLPASRTDGPPAAQPDGSGQQAPPAATPAEPTPRTTSRDRPPAVVTSLPESDDRLHRTSDSPRAAPPDGMAPEMPKAASGEGSVDTTSTPPPRGPNDQQPEQAAELRAPVVISEATPTTRTARSEPTGGRTDQPLAPVASIVVAVGPPDSGSFAPRAAQVDQEAYPAPQAMTQPAANVAAVVLPEAPLAISPPRLTDKGAPTDTPAPARIPTLGAKERERAEQMVARDERDLADGNVAQARLFFLNAAKAGLPRGALLLAATYDPRELAQPSILGVQPNIALARQWYERARELGSTEAAERLGGLVGK